MTKNTDELFEAGIFFGSLGLLLALIDWLFLGGIRI
jgi:hypothetical protein